VDRIRVWSARAVAMAGFAAYALLAPAGPSGIDASELAAAGFRLGSPPATGYPLSCMLSRLASMVPVGEIAWRVHLLGAACAAVAMLWIARLVAAVGAGRGQEPGGAAVASGVAAALLLGVALGFARHASVTDAAAPVAALLVATLLLFDRVARGGDARFGLLLAMVVGLGVGAHAGYRLLVPLPLLALLWIRLHRGARWPLVAPLVTVATAAALHLYLPVRSATGRIAAVDRGHPRDLEALGQHVATPLPDPGSIGGIDVQLPALEVAAEKIARVAAALADELGALGLFAALAGAIALVAERRSRWLLILLATAAASDAVAGRALSGETGAIAERHVGALIALAVLAGVGVAWLGRAVARSGGAIASAAGAATAAAAGAMLLVAPAMATWAALRPDAGDARRLAEAALDDTPPRGLLLTHSEPLSSILVYLTAVEGARPDVAALERSRLLDIERTRALAGGPLDVDRPLLGLLDLGRPVAWEPGEDPIPAPIEMRSTVGLLKTAGAGGTGSAGDHQMRTRFSGARNSASSGLGW
jgi:hypothetical protein